MEHSIDAYTDERLQQGLDYAEKSLQRRDITPRSVIFMNQYKEQISDAMNASANEDRVAYTGGVRLMEHLLNTELFLRASPPENVKQLQQEILALREFQYFARYGDYLQKLPNQVRKFVYKNDPSDKQLMLLDQNWTKLGKILSGEDSSDSTGKVRTNLVALIVEASDGLALDYKLVEFSIVEYGKRNNQVHRDLDHLKQHGTFSTLGQLLSEDWKDVDLVFSEVRPKVDLDHLKRIIESEIDLCFHTYDGGYGDYNKWAPTDHLRSLELKNKPAGKAPSSPVLSDATQSSLERGESGISTTRKGKKRVASSGEPRGSERATNKRIALLGKKARLEERLADIDIELARIERKVEKGKARLESRMQPREEAEEEAEEKSDSSDYGIGLLHESSSSPDSIAGSSDKGTLSH